MEALLAIEIGKGYVGGAGASDLQVEVSDITSFLEANEYLETPAVLL